MSKFKVNIVGAGRVGKTLLGLLQDLPDYSIQDVLSSRYSTALDATQSFGAGRAVKNYADLEPADLWVLTVPDTQIAIVAAKIAKSFKDRDSGGSPPLAFHCSGYFPATEMAPLRELGWGLASMHPVLTFSDPVTAMQQFNGTYCGVEGDTWAVESVEQVLQDLGAISFQLNADSKSLYHAAAVFSNNFTVVLQAIAREAWSHAGVPDDIAVQLNATLLKATYESVVRNEPSDALTGPAARGDMLVVTKQGFDVANWHPVAGKLYKNLSLLAQKLKLKGNTR